MYETLSLTQVMHSIINQLKTILYHRLKQTYFDYWWSYNLCKINQSKENNKFEIISLKGIITIYIFE